MKTKLEDNLLLYILKHFIAAYELLKQFHHVFFLMSELQYSPFYHIKWCIAGLAQVLIN